jgi:hypothetical protein
MWGEGSRTAHEKNKASAGAPRLRESSSRVPGSRIVFNFDRGEASNVVITDYH